MQLVPINKPRGILRVILLPLRRLLKRRPTTTATTRRIRPLRRPPRSSIPALRVEARRRSAERSAPLTQPARRPRARVASALVVQVRAVAAVAAHGVLAGGAGCVLGVCVVEAVVAVVGGALRGVA